MLFQYTSCVLGLHFFFNELIYLKKKECIWKDLIILMCLVGQQILYILMNSVTWKEDKNASLNRTEYANIKNSEKVK